MANISNLWVEEKYKDHDMIRYEVEDVLYSKKSEFQHIQVVKTKGFGKMLLNDGIVMVSERDEFVYHEMITHVPLFVHPCPKNVLVIGGGDGGTVREVLRHPTIEQCQLVEIDPVVIEVCRKFLPQLSSKLNDPRVAIHISDGAEYVKTTSCQFDLVIVDSTDPIGPSLPLFDKAFYENVHRILTHDGLVVCQCESPFLEPETQVFLLNTLRSLFPIVNIYNYVNLTYGGGFWSFGLGSKKYHPLNDYEIQKTKGWHFQYYNPKIHVAAFQLPTFMNQKLGFPNS